MVTTGRYLVIEGSDGTGKSTQVDLVAAYLCKRGVATMVIHEPAGTPMADALRNLVKDGRIPRQPLTNLLLFTAARYEAWQVAQAALDKGQWVLSARNYLSTLAYQGGGEGVDEAIIMDLTARCLGQRYLQPDLTVVLSLDEATRRQRLHRRNPVGSVSPDTFEQRADQFQAAVNASYHRLATQYKLPLLNAAQSATALRDQIIALIKPQWLPDRPYPGGPITSS